MRRRMRVQQCEPDGGTRMEGGMKAPASTQALMHTCMDARKQSFAHARMSAHARTTARARPHARAHTR
eukprot:10323603-Alexandrium_andersonii.AAC.1